MVVTEEGLPIVAYFGFPEETLEGVPPALRPVGAASIPAVLLATASADGVWTRGAVAMEDEIPNVTVAFGPASEPSVADLTHESVTGLQLAIDGRAVSTRSGARARVCSTPPAPATPTPPSP